MFGCKQWTMFIEHRRNFFCQDKRHSFTKPKIMQWKKMNDSEKDQNRQQWSSGTGIRIRVKVLWISSCKADQQRQPYKNPMAWWIILQKYKNLEKLFSCEVHRIVGGASVKIFTARLTQIIWIMYIKCRMIIEGKIVRKPLQGLASPVYHSHLQMPVNRCIMPVSTSRSRVTSHLAVAGWFNSAHDLFQLYIFYYRW